KRVAVIASHAFAMIRFRGPLIAELVQRDVAAFALAPDYNEDLKDQVRALRATPVDYSLSRTGLNPIADLASFIGLVITLRRLDVDVVITYHIKPVIYGTLAAVIARVPHRYALIDGLGYILTDDPTGRTQSPPLVRWSATNMYRVALRFSRKVFFLNHDDRRRFEALKIVKDEKAVML